MRTAAALLTIITIWPAVLNAQTAIVPIPAEIERQKIELAIIKIKGAKTPLEIDAACRDLLDIRESQENCNATCRAQRDWCTERHH
jgi:hypothetical protein